MSFRPAAGESTNPLLLSFVPMLNSVCDSDIVHVDKSDNRQPLSVTGSGMSGRRQRPSVASPFRDDHAGRLAFRDKNKRSKVRSRTYEHSNAADIFDLQLSKPQSKHQNPATPPSAFLPQLFAFPSIGYGEPDFHSRAPLVMNG